MPSVTLTYANGNVANPGKIHLNDSDQTITFNLRPSASSFAATPIVFPHPAPAGYNNWPGPAPTVSGNTVTAKCNKPLGVGQTETYKYNIVWNGGELDPEVGNVGEGPVKPHSRPVA